MSNRAYILAGIFILFGALLIYVGYAFPQSNCFAPSATPAPGPQQTNLYYLSSFAQTANFSPLVTTSHGALNVACRTGWRIIQPTSGTPVWTSIDACQAAAYSVGMKWSLSIKIGADTPLWMFNNTCTATPQSGESAPGSGTMNAETFTWNQNFEYTNGSTQCLPVPWEAGFLSSLNAFIQLVAAHAGPNGTIGTDPKLDHVVVTGLNSITQENLQPYQASDLTQWEHWLSVDGMQCSGLPSACPQYNAAIVGAYNTIIADWGTAFTNSVGLASMYVDQPSFPFNTTNNFAQSLMQQLIAYNQVRSLPMNNAAQVSNNQPYFPAPILTLQSANQRVAFQELSPQGCPQNPLTLINGATSASVYALEIYPADLSCL